jgi:membrane protein DedA with SNARE-associated domain
MSPPKINAADRWFEVYGAGGIFVARLLPAIRHVISIPAGLFRMNFKTFSIMTILGAGVFHAALAWFGMRTLGSHPELMRDPKGMMDALKADKFYFVGFAVAVALLYWLMTWMQKRAKRTA